MVHKGEVRLCVSCCWSDGATSVIDAGWLR